MRRRAVIGSSSLVAAVAAIACACACAKAPEARSNGRTDSSADAGVASALSDVSASEAGPDADGRFPGLPMPQKFPHVAWDAAGAPRDAALAPSNGR